MIRKEKNRGNPRHSVVWVGRSERIRTSDPCVPNAVLYQAELHSDSCVSSDLSISLNCQGKQFYQRIFKCASR